MPSYQKTISELFDLQLFAIKLGLDNIRAFCTILGQPHLNYPVIHIAGTNGKGSCAFFLNRVLKAHGLRCGLYTSPHIKDFRERIRIGDEPIEQNHIMRFWETHREWVIENKVTFFDATTALAFDYFSKKGVDVAVIETGLGGRLDSTNIVEPAVVLITPISFDHQKQLGKTLSQIAAEKAGIIKKDVPVICTHQKPKAKTTIAACTGSGLFHYLPEKIALRKVSSTLDGLQFEIRFKDDPAGWQYIQTKQSGDFQAWNIAAALYTARLFLSKKQKSYDWKSAKLCLKPSQWPGRLEVISRSPYIFYDVSHNNGGIKSTVAALEKFTEWSSGKRYLLLGLVNDKDLNKIAAFLANRFDFIVVTEPNTVRRQSSALLENAIKRYSEKVLNIKDPQKAFEWVYSRLESKDCLLVMGSHYLIGEMPNHLTSND